MANLYKDLGIEKSASQSEIKKAYKSKANKYHPDKDSADEEKFHAVALAYSVLSDPKRREEYDKSGSTKKKQGPEQIAETVILTWLSEIFELESMPRDIIRELDNRIEAGIANLRKSQNQTKFRKRKFEGLLGRIKASASDNNLAENVLNKKISDCQIQIEKIEEEFKVSDRMKELLSDYEDTEKEPVLNAFLDGFQTGPTTSSFYFLGS